MGDLRFRQIHLDFHTSECIDGVGDKFDAAEFADTLKKAGVNSVTCFARCHHGMIYYDTDFPGRHPHLHRNLLMEQIDACHAVGINVPIYITVGWDEYIAKLHPEWLERSTEGSPNGSGPLQAGWRKLCLNTPYVEYVERQTIDVLEKFGEKVDGIFFDIIFQNQCCCSYCMDGMKKAGLNPLSEMDRRDYANRVVNIFKKRMTETVRKYNKDCAIFYNAGHVGPLIRETLDAYTHLELESLPSGGWGYEHFPITARFARNLGYEFLAMTGRFHKSWADFGGYKNQPALEYECFTALAHGAKCSVGDQLHPNGAINKATYELIGSVYNQIKEKEKWCDDVVGVSEIGVISPEIIPTITDRLHPAIKGVYRMLSEAHYQFDIIDQYMDFGKYKVIILPDVIAFDDKAESSDMSCCLAAAGHEVAIGSEDSCCDDSCSDDSCCDDSCCDVALSGLQLLRAKLQQYINNGGKVILSYHSGMNASKSRFLLDGIGVEPAGEAEYSPDYFVAGEMVKEGLLDTEHVNYERGMLVRTLPGTETLARIINPYFNRTYEHFCSHAQTPAEKDSGYPYVTMSGNSRILYFSHPIFGMYSRNGLRAYKLIFLNSLKLLLQDKLIETNAPTTAQIYLNYQPEERRHVVHILHYIPERRFEQVDTIEDVIPLYNVALSVKLPNKPGDAYLAPSGKKLDFTYDADGYTHVIVPEVVGHQMIVFE